MAQKTKKLRIEDLITQAKERKEGKNKPIVKELYIKSLDANIIITKPDDDVIDDSIEMEGRDGDKYLVYSCVLEPNLKDKVLQDAYGCLEPMDIVSLVFEKGEIVKISQYILELAGYGNSVKELKN